MTRYEMENILLDFNIVSEETLNVVVKMCGVRPDTYEDLLYVVTGYRTFESYLEANYEEQYSYEFVGDKLCVTMKGENKQ